MSFNNYLTSLRKLGRSVILPVKAIKKLCYPFLLTNPSKTVLDFGSGTLFWTDWFVAEGNCNVCAVDTYYRNTIMPPKRNVTYYADINHALHDVPFFDLVWTCDVLHHLSSADCADFLQKVTTKTNSIIIKDIDARHKFGNFMNKLHDKIINSETVYDVDPYQIKAYFESCGFDVAYYFIPKIWYPHFMLIISRRG
jgi:cyclopropane fatty-acyl-phospholipid synthase-like methyltransferase